MNSVYVLPRQKLLKLGEEEERYTDITAPRIKLTHANQFYRSLAFLYRSGHPISNSFRLLAAGMEKQNERLACLKVYANIRRGMTLSQSFLSAGFPLPLAAVVKAGENSGRLDETLAWYANFEERNEEIRRQLLQALLYPTIVLTFALALAFVMPPLVLKEQLTILANSGAELPALSQGLLYFSRLVGHPLVFLALPALWFVALVLRATLQLSEGRRRIELYLSKVPMVGAGLKRASAARSLALLSLLLRSGLPLTKALELAGEGSGSLLLQERLSRCALALREGKRLFESLERTRWYLPSTMNLLAAGEASGELAELIGLASALEEDNFRERLQRFSAVLQPAMMLLVGALVCLTIIAVLGPSLSLIQGL